MLFFFARTTELKKPVATIAEATTADFFNIQQFIDSAKTGLTPNQALYISKLENGITRGDVPAQQINAYKSLASFWKDSIKLFEPYGFYIYE